MTSAWGIQHDGDGDVAKSYVPGKGFTPATKLGAKGLRKVVQPGQYASRGRTPEQKAAVKAIGDNRKFFAERSGGRKLTRDKKSGVYSGEASLSDAGIAGAAWKLGGKNGKKIYLHDPSAGTSAATLKAHETAHVSPKKRTEYRLARIVTDPKKGMREEARADAAAGVNYRKARPTDTGYPSFARSSSDRATRRSQIKIAGSMGGNTKDEVKAATGKFSGSSYKAYRGTADRINRARGTQQPRGLKDDYRKARVGEAASTAAAAGVVGGGAYAMTRDGKPKQKKVSKMATSAWGLSHGDDVSKAWSDKQLQSHKKAQVGFSSGAAALGVAALGAKGIGAGAPKLGALAAKSSRMKVSGGQLKKISGKGHKAAENLSIGAAGVGGIGGFNFAGIQAAEAKRTRPGATRVRKAAPKGADRRKAIDRGQMLGMAGGAAATLALPGVRQGAVGTAKLGRSLYQGSKATSGGLKAIGSGQKVRGTMRNAGGNMRRAGAAAGKATAFGATATGMKAPGQSLAAAYMPAAGALGGGVVASERFKRKERIGKSMDGLDFGLGGVRQGAEISKAYDPEKKRMRRLDTYNAAGNVAAGALGAAAVGNGRTAVRGAKHALKADAITKPTLKLVGTKAGKAGALGLGAVGAAVGADRIKQYRRGNGRSYRALNQ